MQESFREKDHLLSLKVMRLTKPSIKPLIPISSEEQDLPGVLFNNQIANNVAASKGAEYLSTGELLSLPQAFGSIYLGETFSCYVSILNDSNQISKDVSLKTDIQTTSQRIQLTSCKPKDVLGPDESVDEVLNYEVKELGTHILICAVTYHSSAGEKLYMRRFYKFQVLKPLEVKTKFYNAENDVLFLEAQVQNITTSPLCIQHVILDQSHFYAMKSLNFLPNEKRNLESVDASDLETELFGSTYMNPLDTRQYLYKLYPKIEHLRELRSKPVTPIGKLDIVWRTNFGESGRLQTSQLQKNTPNETDVRLILLQAPDVVRVQKQFQLKCRLENSGTSKMEVQLFLNNPKTDSLLWCGISGKILGPLPPNSHLILDLYAIAIKPGLVTIDGVRILDMNSTKVYEFDGISRVLVHATQQSPFKSDISRDV